MRDIEGYAKGMSPQLKALYEEVKQEYLRLEGKWEFIHALFGVRENVDLVNGLGMDTAYLYRTIEDALFTELTLGICRLTDPAFTGKHANLSLEYLIDQAEKNGNERSLQVCREKLQQLQSTCSGIRETRDKKKAHKDKAVAMREMRIGRVVYTDFRDAVVKIGDFLNVFGEQYGEPHSIWDLNLREAASPIWKALNAARRSS